jgi:UDP-GlcNAc:undecaprenyl-phosphate GlcNAc-1-phosphate transferase
MLDAPDGNRKNQARPVPVAGGVAVFSSALLTLLLVALIDSEVASALSENLRKSIGLLFAAGLITAVGVIDDRYNLRARFKLGGQLVAILVLVVGGDFVAHSIGLFGYTIELGRFDVPFTVLWLLGCVNALNLIDGMDGLLGTVGGIALLSLGIIAAGSGHIFAACVAFALAGAVIGFLWWNLPPATIYMGDAGSMLIGLVIGAVAIPASLKGPATIWLGAPVAILVLPMFDTFAAIVRRKLTGRGLASPDCGHLHHRMMDRGLTPPRVLGIVALLGIVAATGGLVSIAWSNDLYALVAAGTVVIALVVPKLFGHAELGLIRARISRFARRLLLRDKGGFGLTVRLQGSANWERIWDELTGYANRLNLQSMCLNVNSPVLRENYHAQWENPHTVHENCLLQLEIPLFGKNGSSLGRLGLVVARDPHSLTDVFIVIARLIEILESKAGAFTKASPNPTVERVPTSDPTPTPVRTIALRA